MIPLGYLYKQIAARPPWLKAEQVADIYSISNCISDDFTDYIPYWKHNGYWLFNTPDIIVEIASEASLSLDGHTLFYYEAYELQYDEDDRTWLPFAPESSFVTDVVIPVRKKLEGFDVASFSLHNLAECSPLSCNGLAAELPANAHCLFATLEEAKAALEQGDFDDSEPGPFRIVAVYSTDGNGDAG